MAQYYTDFSEYTVGVQPSDWTQRWQIDQAWTVEADAGAPGGKVLRSPVETGDVRRGWTWDAIDADADRADVEIFAQIKYTGVAAESDLLLTSRGSGTSSSVTTYRHGARPYNNEVALSEYVGSNFDYVGDVKFYTMSAGTSYDVLVQVRGTAHKIKAWVTGESEPAAWDVEAIDSSISAAGWVGLLKYRGASTDVSVFSVGTGTDSALRAPVTPTTATLDTAAASATSATEYAATVNTDKNSGTLYHVITQSVTKPTATQIKAAENDLGAAAVAGSSQAVTATGEQSVSGAGLTGGENYYAHFVQNTTEGDSNVISSPQFTATANPVAVLTAPTATHDGGTGYTGTVSADTGSGTLSHVVTTSTTKPTATQVIAAENEAGTAAVSSGSVSVTATGEQSVSGTGLSADVTYYIHFVQNTIEGDSLVVSSTGFSFAAAVPTPINLSVTSITETSAQLNWQAG